MSRTTTRITERGTKNKRNKKTRGTKNSYIKMGTFSKKIKELLTISVKFH